jgi:uracil-DNA glycosylase family 4
LSGTEGGERAEPADTAARLARSLREKLLLERSFGFEVPLVWPPQAALPVPQARNGAGDLDPERRRRTSLLEPIREEVRACRLCVLCRGRTQTVFGVGDPCARLMFIGEGPGEDEDRQGEPFVGKAGRLLDRMIQAMGLARENVYIANIVKCRPPGNRNPEPREIVACLPYLRRQVEIIRPEVICALGNVAARTLLDSQLPISRIRGRFGEFLGIPVLPTFHPAYLLRNIEDKRLAWEDLRKLMARLGLKSHRPERGRDPGAREPY